MPSDSASGTKLSRTTCAKCLSTCVPLQAPMIFANTSQTVLGSRCLPVTHAAWLGCVTTCSGNPPTILIRWNESHIAGLVATWLCCWQALSRRWRWISVLLPSHERSTAFALMQGKGAGDTSLAEVGIVMGVLLCKCAPQINAVAPAHLFDLAILPSVFSTRMLLFGHLVPVLAQDVPLVNHLHSAAVMVLVCSGEFVSLRLHCPRRRDKQSGQRTSAGITSFCRLQSAQLDCKHVETHQPRAVEQPMYLPAWTLYNS